MCTALQAVPSSQKLQHTVAWHCFAAPLGMSNGKVPKCWIPFHEQQWPEARYQGITVRALFLFVGNCWHQVLRSPKPSWHFRGTWCWRELPPLGAHNVVPSRYHQAEGMHWKKVEIWEEKWWSWGLPPCGVMWGGYWWLLCIPYLTFSLMQLIGSLRSQVQCHAMRWRVWRGGQDLRLWHPVFTFTLELGLPAFWSEQSSFHA